MSSTRCPSCRRPLALPETLRGALVRCPACAATFRAPGAVEPVPRSAPPAVTQSPDAVTLGPATGEDRIAVSPGEGGTDVSTGRPPPRRTGPWRKYTVLLVLVLVTCVVAVRYLAPDEPGQRPLAQKLMQSAVGLLQCFGIFVGVAVLLASVDLVKQAVARHRRRRRAGHPGPGGRQPEGAPCDITEGPVPRR